DHVAVRGGAAHAELVGDVGDAQDRALGGEAAEDRQTSLERLREAGFAQARYGPSRSVAVRRELDSARSWHRGLPQSWWVYTAACGPTTRENDWILDPVTGQQV